MRFEPWISCDGALCENPLWDGRAGRMLWTDIDNGRIFSCALDSSSPELLYHGPGVGGFTLQEDGTLLLFRQQDISRLDAQGGVAKILDFHHEGSRRFNDVAADAQGRIFAGTIGKGGGRAGCSSSKRTAAIGWSLMERIVPTESASRRTGRLCIGPAARAV